MKSLASILTLSVAVASADTYFPPPESEGGWRKLEAGEEIREKAGMDPNTLAELKQWLLDSDNRDFAAVVMRHGYIVLEVERGNSAKTDSRRVASVSKAICATVLAIASEQSQRGLTPKRMKFDDLAFDFIPWAQPFSDARKTKITVKQLLNHTSGICPEATGAPNDGSWEYIMGHSGEARTAKLAFDPGAGCGYSTHALAHAALVCETVTGLPYDQFAIQALFKPLGIEHWWFQFYEGGQKYGRHPSHGLGMPARDLARIAYCMLRGGRWKDRQVIPKWFVEETAAPTHDVKTPEMRWKLNPQIFSHGWELPARLTGEGGRSGSGIPADARAKPGSGGQYIAFVPSLDLVITRQTGSSGDWQFEEYLRRACASVVQAKTALGGRASSRAALSAPRTERFAKIETISVGEFSVDLCRREDGAFGLGEIRRATLPLRRADFLITWQVDGKFPVFERRDGLTVVLRDPASKLTFARETRDCAGTRLSGFKMRFQAERGSIVETASWELGGSSCELTYFDGYRGWHGPPAWQRADAVPPTNPKLTPSLLAGTGFQFEHGPDGALIHFHTSPGDRLRNASRGEALEFETSFHGPATVDRFIFVAAGDSRLNLWTRAYEVAHAELRRAFGLPEPAREIFLQWPPFSRKGFRETASQCAAVTSREGFTGASINVVWDNADFRGGAKNMNVWDYTVCEGYGGGAALKELTDECRKHDLRVVAWVPAGHLWSKSPVWQAHPEWVLLNARGEKFVNPAGGIWHGALDTGFHDYWRDRVVDVVRRFGIDGLWLDTHLSYAQQSRPPDHNVRLAAIYGELTKAGARHLLVEGDASAFGSYSIAIDDDWEKEGRKIPDPDLYYGSMLAAGSMNPRFYLNHFRRYVAAGAPWIIDWDFLFSSKLKGAELEAARHEVRQVVQDYRRVKDRMVHRFAHADGGGYTWTNDRDGTKVVWLLKPAQLPNGQKGEAGQVYLIESK